MPPVPSTSTMMVEVLATSPPEPATVVTILVRPFRSKVSMTSSPCLLPPLADGPSYTISWPVDLTTVVEVMWSRVCASSMAPT